MQAQQIRPGSAFQPVEIFLPDRETVGAERKWTNRKPTKGVKDRLHAIRAEIADHVRNGREAAGLTREPQFTEDGKLLNQAAELAFAAEPDPQYAAQLLELNCRQINILSEPAAESSQPLGDELLERWRLGESEDPSEFAIVDDEIIDVRDALLEGLGKPSAS